MAGLRLTAEMVPRTAWWSNVRTNVSRKDWERCKQYTRQRSGSRCEICGGVGSRYPTDAHEVWSYDEATQVQTLVDLIALCPSCHQVKHIGRAAAIGRLPEALAHFMNVNELDDLEAAQEYLIGERRRWEYRSQFQWQLDVSFLTSIGIDLPDQLDREKVAQGG